MIIAAPPHEVQAQQDSVAHFPVAIDTTKQAGSEIAPSAAVLTLPNKYGGYAEFSGYDGEKRLKKILRAILPSALYRTWEIFTENQAQTNDCFLSLERLAQMAERTEHTMRRNLAELESKELLTMRPERKVFTRADGTTYTRMVVVKDFAGLYKLAHEYHEWSWSAQYVEADRAYVSLIRAEGLEAKLRRFDNYRRVLYTRLPGPEAQISQECEWFRSYQEDAERVETPADQKSDRIRTKYLPKQFPEEFPKVSQNESKRITQKDSLGGDSFDSGRCPETREAGAEMSACSQSEAPIAGDYTKTSKGQELQNESTNPNPVPSPSAALPRSAGKTRESAEMHQDVQRARAAMAAAGIAPGQNKERQAENLPTPPRHPLARSFVQACAGVFGDLNPKGSKTGLERSIETFELEGAQVLMCLVRAYGIARDTVDEKVRYHRPDGAPNRMPLFCSMFKKFARALASDSPWDYSWEQMCADIAGDDGLGLWVTGHQAELRDAAGAAGTREDENGERVCAAPQDAEEIMVNEERKDQAQSAGWSDRADAHEQGERLLYAIAVEANYTGIEVKVRHDAGRYYVVYCVLPTESYQGRTQVIGRKAEVDALIQRALAGQL